MTLLADWWRRRTLHARLSLLVTGAVAAAVVAGQSALFVMIGGSKGGPSAQLIAFAAMDLVMFYATFGIGRGLGQRRLKRRKGVR